MPKETPEVEENSEGESTEKELEDLFNEDEPDDDEKSVEDEGKSKKADEKSESKEEDEELEEPDKESDEESDEDKDKEESEEEDKGEKSAKDIALEAADKIKEAQDKDTQEKEKVEAEEKAKVEAEAFSVPGILKDAELSTQAKEFIQEFGELPEIIEAIDKVRTEKLYDDFNGVIGGVIDQFNGTIASLVGEITLTKNVPNWEDLIFSNKTDKDGKRLEKDEFTAWLKEQPDAFQTLYESKNPMDNVKLLKCYQHDLDKDKATVAEKKKKDKLQKEKDKHGHSPAAGKSTQKKKATSGTWEEEWNNPATEPEDD